MKTEIPATQPPLPTSAPVTLTMEQLQQLLTAAAGPKDNQFSTLVDAIIESRKPYVDPRRELDDEEFRRTMREQVIAKRRAEENSQRNCPHVKGATGSQSYGQSAFWYHRLDTNETIGICSQCQKVISSLIREHAEFFKMRGDNIAGGAGLRMFLDPMKALTARMTPDEKRKVEEGMRAAN